MARKRVRSVLAGCMAVMGLFAVNAVAAQADAPSWLVGGTGTFLGTGVAEPVTATNKVGVSPRLKIPAVGAEILCKKSSAAGKIVGNAAANGVGTNKEVVVTYEECEVVGFPLCRVGSNPPAPPATGKIVTNSLKSELVWLAAAGNEVGDLLQPEAGANFVSLWFEGTCPLPVNVKVNVTGAVIGKIVPNAGAAEQVNGELIFPEPAITNYWAGGAARVARTLGVAPAPNPLKVGANAATYVDEQTVMLNSGAKWGTKGH